MLFGPHQAPCFPDVFDRVARADLEASSELEEGSILGLRRLGV
jgi:hypothetical protein